MTGHRHDSATDRWSRLSTSNQPSLRQGATAVWAGDEMLLFGGRGRLGSLDNFLNRHPLTTPLSLCGRPQATTRLPD